MTSLSKPLDGPAPVGWQKGKTEILFFLIKSEEHKKNGPANFADCTLTPRRLTDMLDLTVKDTLQVATMDFKILTKPEDVLKAVRAAAAAPNQDKVKRKGLGVPWKTEAFEKLWQGSGAVLTVPVDARLEKLAKEWFKSKDREFRLLGVRALGEFKSEENIRLMKDLLQSRESSEVTSSNGRYRYYPFRQTAYEALKTWGIDVKKPIIEEPLD